MEHYANAVSYRYLQEKILRIGHSLIQRYSDPFGLSLKESSHPVQCGRVLRLDPPSPPPPRPEWY